MSMKMSSPALSSASSRIPSCIEPVIKALYKLRYIPEGDVLVSSLQTEKRRLKSSKSIVSFIAEQHRSSSSKIICCASGKDLVSNGSSSSRPSKIQSLTGPHAEDSIMDKGGIVKGVP